MDTEWCTECHCFAACSGSFDLIGNGYCDDETNVADCNFDGGDCCELCKWVYILIARVNII